MEAFPGPDCLHTWQKFHATAERAVAAIRASKARFYDNKVDHQGEASDVLNQGRNKKNQKAKMLR